VRILKEVRIIARNPERRTHSMIFIRRRCSAGDAAISRDTHLHLTEGIRKEMKA
jgi:hypothetical protein